MLKFGFVYIILFFNVLSFQCPTSIKTCRFTQALTFFYQRPHSPRPFVLFPLSTFSPLRYLSVFHTYTFFVFLPLSLSHHSGINFLCVFHTVNSSASWLWLFHIVCMDSSDICLSLCSLLFGQHLRMDKDWLCLLSFFFTNFMCCFIFITWFLFLIFWAGFNFVSSCAIRMGHKCVHCSSWPPIRTYLETFWCKPLLSPSYVAFWMAPQSRFH